MSINIEYTKNFKKIDSLTDKFSSEYDIRNGINYNFDWFSFIAKENDKIVGYLIGFSHYSEAAINSIMIIEKYKEKCIGSMLIQKVEDYYKGKGFTNINLITNEFQGFEFYKKHGFELEFVRKNKYNLNLTKYFFIKYFNKNIIKHNLKIINNEKLPFL